MNGNNVTYRKGDFMITEDKRSDWQVRLGEATIEKHDDCIVAEMVNFSPKEGVKYGVMYQFPDEKILIEL